MADYDILLVKKTFDDEVEYSWTAPNGRQFNVREMGQSYFLEELRPAQSGTYFQDGKMVCDGPLVQRIAGLARSASPSAFYAGLPAEVPREMISYLGGGLGAGAILYPSLRAAKEAIHAALEADAWYLSHQRAPAAEAALAALDEEATLLREARESVLYWQKKRAGLDDKAQDAPEAFRGLSNAHGPLERDHRYRLLAYRNAPSAKTWGEVANMIVLAGHVTCWQVWLNHDATAPRSRSTEAWARWPEPEQFFGHLAAERQDLIREADRRLARARKTVSRLAREAEGPSLELV